jgi:hypothetical protein
VYEKRAPRIQADARKLLPLATGYGKEEPGNPVCLFKVFLIEKVETFSEVILELHEILNSARRHD